jgi:4-amino-4-deoxy-L-arabinose transferase-like glycosyltransferase
MRPTIQNAPLAVALILLLAAAFFIPGLHSDTRLHPDEALYATYGRIVARGDPLLIGVGLDKPPLLFYAIAASFRLLGDTEFAARVPGVIASLLSIAAAYAITKRVYGLHTALLTAFLLAISPMVRAFAATAFTDPLMLFFLLLSVLMVVRGGWRWSGVWIGLALAVKPSALQWIPLVILLGIAAERQLRWKHIRRFGLAFGGVLLLLILWQLARDTYPDWWALNSVNNNPGRFIRAEEIAPRFATFGGYAMMIFPLWGMGWLSVITNLTPAPSPQTEREIGRVGYGAAEMINFQSRIKLFNPHNFHFLYAPLRKRRGNGGEVLFDLLLTASTLGSLSFLWLVAFNTYDRYLLALAPFVLMLVARVLVRIGLVRAMVISLLVVIFLTPPLHIGGDDGAYTGIDQLAVRLNALPAGTVVYEHWLGWELGYYLGAHPAIKLVWLPTVRDLINAPKPSYLVAPQREAAAWLDELSKAGINFQKVYTFGRFAVYEVGTFAAPVPYR